MTLIKPKTLTPSAFRTFGDVIEVNDNAKKITINDGFTQRYHDLAKIDVNDQNGQVLVNIFRSTPLALPISIKMMERHPLGSQAFIPLGNHPYLIVVAPAGKFTQDKIEVFIASENQGVNYHKGVWHHYCLALNAVSDFLVIDRGGQGENCDLMSLDGTLNITLGDEKIVAGENDESA